MKGEMAFPTEVVNDFTQYAEYHHAGAADAIRNGLKDDWSYVNADGKLTKRIEAAFYKHFKDKMSVYVSRRLEQLINKHYVASYYYRITDRLDWEKGEYGDGSSCFWSWNNQYRAVFVNGGGMAIIMRRALDASKMGDGMGRAFLLPHEGGIIVGNNYGPSIGHFVKVLREHLGVPEVKEAKANIQLKATFANRQYNNGFYDNGNSVALYVDKVPDMSYDKPAVFDGCYCSAKFSNASTDGTRKCENCPFTEEELDA